MTMLLAGDIGGTKTILRLVKTAADPSLIQPVALATLYERTYPSRDFPDLVPMVQTFLGAAATAVGGEIKPKAACFGIAGPVVDNTSQLTNLSWSLDAGRLAADLSIAQVQLINDFAAIGYGVPHLSEQDLHPVQVAPARPDAPIAVLGAGTGLGECFLIPYPEGYHVFASEGGHADFAPRTELEFELMQYFLNQEQLKRVSVERVVSGLGIVSIYQMLKARGTYPESLQFAEVFKTWFQEQGQPEQTVDPAAAIATAAMKQQDQLFEQTMRVFVQAYGAEVGNLALKLLPYGGLYIAGGIAAKILPLLQQGEFMTAFRHKGRVSPLLQNIPIHVVLNPKVGLIGAAHYAARLVWAPGC